MNICLVSKYPPIEGQVSTVNYWLTRGLARAGHQVIVVTNADEVDSTCRVFFDGDDDTLWLKPTFTNSGGKVIVLNTPPFDHSQFHIPWSNPFVTKLTSLTLRAVKEFGAELIFSHYLEPYAIAGYLASTWMAVPHLITHAGSDIGRLMKNPILRPTYTEVIRRATCFIPKNQKTKRMSDTSYKETLKLSPYTPPEEAFNSSIKPLDLNDLLSHASGIIHNDLKWHTKKFDPTIPTIGTYGKLFEVRGIYDLVEALGLLRQRGFISNLLIMSRWRRGEDRLHKSIEVAGIEDSTWLLPFLPNWRIPQFINLCDAVCYLERHWPMAVHTSIIPKEVMACGGTLVISEEVRKHPWYRDLLKDMENCIVVDDPKQVKSLAVKLQFILENREISATIGKAAYKTLQLMSGYDDFIHSWEALLNKFLSRGKIDE